MHVQGAYSCLIMLQIHLYGKLPTFYLKKKIFIHRQHVSVNKNDEFYSLCKYIPVLSKRLSVFCNHYIINIIFLFNVYFAIINYFMYL